MPDGETRIRVLVTPHETVAALEARLCAEYDADVLVEGSQLCPLGSAVQTRDLKRPIPSEWSNHGAVCAASHSVGDGRVSK